MRLGITIWLLFECLLLIDISIAYAQTPAINSLKQQLEQQADDTMRVKMLTKLSTLLRATDIVQAEQYAKEAITLAKVISYPSGHARALNSIAVIHRIEGNHQKALSSLLRALNINKILSDTSGICQTLNGIGATYLEMNSYQDALEHFEQVFKLWETTKDTAGMAVSLSNLGDVFEKQQEYEKAIDHHKRSMDYDLVINQPEAANYSLHSLGRIYTTLEDWEKAKHYLFQALAIRKKMSFHYGVSETSAQLAQLYRKKGEHANALLYFQEALLGGRRAKANTLQITALKGLAESHKALGHFEQASKVYEQYIALNDSIFTIEKQKVFTELMAQYEADRKDKENLLLRKDKDLKEKHIEKQQSNILLMTLAIGILVVMLTAGFILYSNKRKTNQLLLNLNNELSRQQQELTEQSQRLEEANEHISLLNASLEIQVQERTQALEESTRNLEMYLYRSAHDLRGPIASIQGLMSIAPMIQDPDELQQMFIKIEDLTQNMLGILEKLNTLASLNDYVVEIVDWEALLADVQRRHHQQAIRKNLEWKVDVPKESGVLTADSRLIKQLLHCVVENAIQFSHHSQHIQISVEEVKEHWTIKVMDKGIGMEDFIQNDAFKPYFRGHANSQGHGLGLYLAKRIIEKLNGSIKLYSIPNSGTTVEISIPLALQQDISEGTSKISQKR